jgi:hypothetical protein
MCTILTSLVALQQQQYFQDVKKKTQFIASALWMEQINSQLVTYKFRCFFGVCFSSSPVYK